jgi:hypothetical protein
VNAHPVAGIVLIRPVKPLPGVVFGERDALVNAGLFFDLPIGERDRLEQAASLGEGLSHGGFATVIDQAQRPGSPEAPAPEPEPQCEIPRRGLDDRPAGALALAGHRIRDPPFDAPATLTAFFFQIDTELA